MDHTYIIIDNNITSTTATHLALEHQDDFVCLGVAQTEKKGLALMLERTPSLVFLNLDMNNGCGGETGFYLMNEIKKYFSYLPEFIVMSTSNSLAIEAVRQNVLDYLLRPLERHLLLGALHRYVKRSCIKQVPDVLCLKSYGDYKFISTDEVLYLKADGNTTDFIRLNGTTTSAYKTLKYFEEHLPDHFTRVHNSYIVNKNYISRIHFGKSQCSIRHATAVVPFSKTYRDNVEMLRKQLSSKSLIIN